ncbi:MAG: hypothetical protein WC887_00780 [Candidatus Paceibacterota bacterium]
MARGEFTPSEKVNGAMQKCRCSTTEEFFERAKLAGNPPSSFDPEHAVNDFLHHGAVPKFVGHFATLVNQNQCPKNCSKSCMRASASLEVA